MKIGAQHRGRGVAEAGQQHFRTWQAASSTATERVTLDPWKPWPKGAGPLPRGQRAGTDILDVA